MVVTWKFDGESCGLKEMSTLWHDRCTAFAVRWRGKHITWKEKVIPLNSVRMVLLITQQGDGGC